MSDAQCTYSDGPVSAVDAATCTGTWGVTASPPTEAWDPASQDFVEARYGVCSDSAATTEAACAGEWSIELVHDEFDVNPKDCGTNMPNTCCDDDDTENQCNIGDTTLVSPRAKLPHVRQGCVIGEKCVCIAGQGKACLLYTSPSPRDQRGSRMPSSA